jgi:hypothetical protein
VKNACAQPDSTAVISSTMNPPMAAWTQLSSPSASNDHSSLAVTTVYLRRLEGQEDRAWREVAEAIGV